MGEGQLEGRQARKRRGKCQARWGERRLQVTSRATAPSITAPRLAQGYGGRP